MTGLWEGQQEGACGLPRGGPAVLPAAQAASASQQHPSSSLSKEECRNSALYNCCLASVARSAEAMCRGCHMNQGQQYDVITKLPCTSSRMQCHAMTASRSKGRIAYLTSFEQIASTCSQHLAAQRLLRPEKVGQDHSFPDQGLGQGSPLALEQEDADAGTHLLHC